MTRETFRPVRETILASTNISRTADLHFPISDNNYGILLIFRDYTFRRVEERTFSTLQDARVGDTIFLPLPQNIADNFSIRIQRFEQGIVGEAVSGILSDTTQGGINLSSLHDAATQAIMRSLPEALSSGGEAFNLLRDTVNNLFGSGSVNASALNRFTEDAAFLIRNNMQGSASGRNIDIGTGTFINPKIALSFEGVELKHHDFTWTLAPKSNDESISLQRIIQTIKKNILPSYVQGSLTTRAMFKYPSTVDIFFVGVDPNFFYYFKPAMISTFNVNYTPNSVSILKGGRPAAIQMNMSLIETDIHTAEDYGEETLSIIGRS
jgi:hypothetical protein